jgi:hypothetical protein
VACLERKGGGIIPESMARNITGECAAVGIGPTLDRVTGLPIELLPVTKGKRVKLLRRQAILARIGPVIPLREPTGPRAAQRNQKKQRENSEAHELSRRGEGRSVVLTISHRFASVK